MRALCKQVADAVAAQVRAGAGSGVSQRRRARRVSAGLVGLCPGVRFGRSAAIETRYLVLALPVSPARAHARHPVQGTTFADDVLRNLDVAVAEAAADGAGAGSARHRPSPAAASRRPPWGCRTPLRRIVPTPRCGSRRRRRQRRRSPGIRECAGAWCCGRHRRCPFAGSCCRPLVVLPSRANDDSRLRAVYAHRSWRGTSLAPT